MIYVNLGPSVWVSIFFPSNGLFLVGFFGAIDLCKNHCYFWIWVFKIWVLFINDFRYIIQWTIWFSLEFFLHSAENSTCLSLNEWFFPTVHMNSHLWNNYPSFVIGWGRWRFIHEIYEMDMDFRWFLTFAQISNVLHPSPSLSLALSLSLLVWLLHLSQTSR